WTCGWFASSITSPAPAGSSRREADDPAAEGDDRRDDLSLRMRVACDWRERADQGLGNDADDGGGREVHILRRHRAGGDALAQEARHALPVLAPVREALGVDQRVDRLV